MGEMDSGAAEKRVRIGVISDTHGLLRPEAVAALEGVQHILHAGDVGDVGILRRLEEIAPVTAIRGNVDTEPPLSDLPPTEMVAVGGRTFYLVHALPDLDMDPVAAGVDAVVYGHSHRPEQRVQQGVIYLNPGSIGPRRFRLPIAMAILSCGKGEIAVQMLELPG